MNIIETSGLGKRYRRTWALRGCTLTVPAGHVVALAGPNGAGKTTLLHLAVGLASPTAGEIRVLGGHRAGSLAAIEGIGFVGQDVPLYRQLSAADTLNLARNLNRAWDQPRAVARLADLGIPPNRKVRQLSGGQQAQLALTVALSKRPRVLVLDEPMARLDPLARHDFLALLMAAVAEDGISVIFSSHVVSELERVADYLIVLGGGQLQMTGEVDDLLAGHGVLTGPAREVPALAPGLCVIAERRAGGQAELLVRAAPGAHGWCPPGWEQHPVGLEELILAYLRMPAAAALPGPSSAQVPA